MRKLFKKISAVICAGAIACTALAFSAFAADNGRCVVYNDAISNSDKAECEKLLNEASDGKDVQLYVLFLNDKTVTDTQVKKLAGTMSNRSTNSVAAVVNYGTNYAFVDAHGTVAERITSSKAQKIYDKYLSSELKDKDNVGAVKAFIKGVKRYNSFLSPIVILIGCIGFLAFFLIFYLTVRTKYKFHEKPNTNAYLEGGDLNFGVMEDIFVSEHTSRTAISSGSSGGGGSGGSHSGGGGHF